jgi:hypothetical protein
MGGWHRHPRARPCHFPRPGLLRPRVAPPGYIGHRRRQGRSGSSGTGVGRTPGHTRPPPLRPKGTARWPSLRSGRADPLPGPQEREVGRRASPPGLPPWALAPAPRWALSEDGERHSLGSAPDHGGQDLLGRSGRLPGGCDHLPTGHRQSQATGSSQMGMARLGQRGDIACVVCGPLV